MSKNKVTVTKVGSMVKIKGINPVTTSEVNSLYYDTDIHVKKVTVGKTYINVIPMYKDSLDSLYEELFNKYNEYNKVVNKSSSNGTSIGSTVGALAELMI